MIITRSATEQNHRLTESYCSFCVWAKLTLSSDGTTYERLSFSCCVLLETSNGDMQFRKGIKVRNHALYLFLFLALWQNPDKSKLRKAFWLVSRVELIVMGACCWSSSHPLQTRRSGKGWRSAAFLLFHFVIHYGPLVHGIVPPTIRVGLPKLNVSRNTLTHVQRCVFLDSKSAQAGTYLKPKKTCG